MTQSKSSQTSSSGGHPGATGTDWKQGGDNGSQVSGPSASPAGQQQQTAPPADGADSMRRAEEAVDEIAQRVGHYTSVLGKGLLRLAARAREEAEDMWAEAQDLRRNGMR